VDRQSFEIGMSLNCCLAVLERSNLMSALKWLGVKHLMQHDEGSRNLTVVAMAVLQADHEGCLLERVSHEIVTGQVMATKLSWHARIEVTSRGLLIIFSQDAQMRRVTEGAYISHSAHCSGHQSDWRWAEGIF
jgi:hypothetical protein